MLRRSAISRSYLGAGICSAFPSAVWAKPSLRDMDLKLVPVLRTAAITSALCQSFEAVFFGMFNVFVKIDITIC